MARVVNQLTAKFVEHVTKPGRYGDGAGLYLDTRPPRRADQVTSAAKRWVLRYTFDGRERELGLGPARDVSLAKARELAGRARELIAQGIDPKSAREADRTAARTAALKQAEAERILPTFGQVADELIASMEPAWRNAKHAAQWRMTLKDYCKPIRDTPVAEVSTEDVLSVLKPLWQSRPETASRLRGRIERVLDAAKAKGMRAGENPAAWRGHLALLLPKPSKLSRGHHAALPYPALGQFMTRLRARPAVAARALEFTILTAARSGEVFGAKWSEIDSERQIWTIPASRMKGGREHRVPLSDPAMAILEAVRPSEPQQHIFSRTDGDRPLSVMAMTMLLRRMDARDITAHGFRSTFRDWTAEETATPNHVAEAALAHTVGDRVEAAYRRGDLFEKRRVLMADWATYCAQPSKLSAVQNEEAAA